jgi:hypothetical protein
MRSTRFRSHHNVNGREKRSCNLLTYTLVVIVLLNISIVASVQQRSTFAILTRISNRNQSSTYQNIRLGFKMDYPNNWTKISEINLNNNYSNVLFVTPENQFPNPKSLFSITVEKFALCKQNASNIASKSCTQTAMKMQKYTKYTRGKGLETKSVCY